MQSSEQRKAAERHHHRVCPWWLGYWLINPLRRLLENPSSIYGTLVDEGMTVLEPGCGMGFFTLDLARRVGPSGRVIALDVQEKMLAGLRRRARRRGLDGRIDARLVSAESLGADDLAGAVDLVVVLHVAHEVPDQRRFFDELEGALKPQGQVLVVEPKGHVSAEEFAASLAAAAEVGLRVVPDRSQPEERAALLARGA